MLMSDPAQIRKLTACAICGQSQHGIIIEFRASISMHDLLDNSLSSTLTGASGLSLSLMSGALIDVAKRH